MDWTEDERQVALSLWVGLVAFAAILYLTESVWKAILIGIFVLVSCLLGFRPALAIAGVICGRSCSDRGSARRSKPRSMDAAVAECSTSGLRLDAWLSQTVPRLYIPKIRFCNIGDEGLCVPKTCVYRKSHPD